MFPDIKTVLDGLRKEGMLLSIATGRSHRSLVKALHHYNLQDYFICLRSTDDGSSKPNLSILLDILQENGVNKNNAVMIGDTMFDMNMVGYARVGGITVDWGYHDRQTLNICNIYSIVTEPLDLPETINRFWQSILAIDSGNRFWQSILAIDSGNRFWQLILVIDSGKKLKMTIDVQKSDQGWVLKDPKSNFLQTPGHHLLCLPSLKMAEKIRDIWPPLSFKDKKPPPYLLQSFFTIIDHISTNPEKCLDRLSDYATYDALSVQATQPAKLAEQQKTLWLPWIEWIGKKTGKKWHTTTKLAVSFRQNPEALVFLRKEFFNLNPWVLFLLQELSALFDSVILALAVHENQLSPEEGLILSRLEENFQISQWGESEDVKKHREHTITELNHIKEYWSFINDL